MDTESFCTTRLISDDPSEKDFFGSHGRVAEAIAQLINKESEGKSIALTGSWGSGKSTVVKLMKDCLDDKTEIFEFDAWAHEGDPLRRTFLEQLIDFLVRKEWDDGQCEKIKCVVSSKIRIETLKSTPLLTTQGKLFGFAALFVPLGLMMFSLATIVPDYVVALGGAFALLPLAALCSLYILKHMPNGKHADNKEDDCNEKNDDILSVLINRSKTINKSESIETPDPTSLEFQRYFKQLLGSALDNEKRKLLIVIDNLDRIDAEDALEIWATMRTFFEFDSNHDAEWKSHLWLLVPFDKNALTRLWHIDDEKNANGKQNGSEQSPSQQLVQSFIDKSFQITFNVASPVHTTWKDFLLTQLNKAFPEHNHDDFHIIYRLYRLCSTSNNKFPTPRDLKLFVNNIGALHRQWCDKIPLPIQALYVILQRDNSNFEDELIKETIADEKILQLIDPKYKEYLAALHFNVSVKDSLQILMGPRIETALTNGDVDKINEMCILTGFAQVCEMVLEDNCPEWLKDNAGRICTAANTLSEVEQNGDSSWLGIWNLLCLNTKRIPYFIEFDEKIGNGLVQSLRHQPDDDFAKSIRHQPDNDFAKSIIILIGKSVSILGDNDPPIEPALLDNWLKGIFTVLMGLQEDHQNLINEHFCIDCSASAYIEIISHRNENFDWDKIRPYFKTKAAPNEVIAELSKKAHDEELSNYLECVPTILQTKPEWQWGHLITMLEQQLQGLKSRLSSGLSG